MRVAELDMTDNTTQCPDSLELRIKASQVGSLDEFGVIGPARSGNPNMHIYYVDGVSLTYGKSPRQHIWTFVSVLNEDNLSPSYRCPCTNIAISNMAQPPPPFLGIDHFCDTAIISGFINGYFYKDDLLWDGADCSPRAQVAPLAILHGSTSNCHRPPLMI